MHASLEQLLSVRDREPVAADVAAHVAECAQCRGELQRLAQVREALRELPQLDADPSAWARIQEGLRSQQQRPRSPRLVVGATAAAVAAVAVLGYLFRSVEPAQQTIVADSQPAPVAQLVAQSQQLDELLAKMPQRPSIQRVSTAVTLDTLEERIQWLDYQLSYASEESLSEEEAQRLWRERVDLMDSLIKVRYAEAGRSSF